MPHNERRGVNNGGEYSYRILYSYGAIVPTNTCTIPASCQGWLVSALQLLHDLVIIVLPGLQMLVYTSPWGTSNPSLVKPYQVDMEKSYRTSFVKVGFTRRGLPNCLSLFA